MIGSAKRVAISPRFDAHSIVQDEERVIKKVNQYKLVATIGSGASSKVYLGIDEVTKEKYAVKRIKLKELCRSSTGIAQLEREIRLMRQFRHHNILKLHEVLHIPESQEVFLVMEYAAKGCVGAFCERHQQLSQESIFSIVKLVGNAILYLHDTGFVHQDIKPWNILLDETGRAILADFGIGHSFQSAAMVVGSPAFQAPEALDDAYYCEDEDEYVSSEEGPQKEDMWALGVTLYQMLFLRLPFLGNNLYEIVRYIKQTSLQIPEGTDERIAELLRGMLNIDPTQRISVRTFLANPLVAGAADFAPDIPDVPPVELIEGRTVEHLARVCPPGYSFACSTMSIQRRLSSINAPFSPERSNRKSLPIGMVFSLDDANSDDDIDVDEDHSFPPLRTLSVANIV